MKTIFRKSLFTLILAALCVSSALILSVLVFMNSLYYEINTKNLLDSSYTLLPLVPKNAPMDEISAFFRGRYAGAYPQSAYRLTLINRDGKVLWDSLLGEELENHADREEVKAALEGRAGKALRDSASAGTRQIYAALPLYGSGGAVEGVVRFSLTVPSFWMRIAPAALPFLLLACFLVFAACIGIFFFSRSLAGSLERLVRIAGEEAHAPWYQEMAPPASLWDEIRGQDTIELITLENALRGMAGELRRRFEQAKTEGRRLQAILGSMAEAVVAVDGRLNLLLVNPRAASLFHLEGAPDRGEGLSLLEATRSTEMEDLAREVLAGGRQLETELKLHADASEQRFRVFAAPLSAGPGAAAEGIVMVLGDITRLVRLEQVRKDFVANVSHELRTPIQLVKGFSETLLDSSLADQVRHCIEIIRKNAETMENLTNDLLTLASLEDGNSGRPEKEEWELAALFDEAVSSVERQAQNKKIKILVDCPPGFSARLHGAFIVQALINLLDNAIKYSPEGRRVWAKA
ncbi:MAG: PAS domain-containing protein, partial [Spirochaetia bacterium]|nr:PAS domain-containing protein [Spirochaetia bacterium]